MSKDAGLEARYAVIKLTNPEKQVEGIFLEFDDPVNASAILTWADEMRLQGYTQVWRDVLEKMGREIPDYAPVSKELETAVYEGLGIAAVPLRMDKELKEKLEEEAQKRSLILPALIRKVCVRFIQDTSDVDFRKTSF